jgi:hypothetical protein
VVHHRGQRLRGRTRASRRRASGSPYGRGDGYGEGPFPFPQYLFFSFTTLTTTGYGNLVPDANPGQTLAVLEMLIGQLFLVTAMARV